MGMNTRLIDFKCDFKDCGLSIGENGVGVNGEG